MSALATMSATDSASEACMQRARERLGELFPDGEIPLPADPIDPGPVARLVALALQTPEERAELAARPHARGMVPITDEVVARTAEQQGWVLREVAAAQAEELAQAETDGAALGRSGALLLNATRPPGGSKGDWYEWRVSREHPVEDVRCALGFAEQHPDDYRAQDTAMRSLQAATALLPESRNGGGRAGAPLRHLIAGDGLAATLKAMRQHRDSSPLQQCACETLAILTSSEPLARAAVAAGALEELGATVERFPRNAKLQWTACNALANIARHREAGPLPESLRQAAATAAFAMASSPSHAGVQGFACAFLWQIALEEADVVASRNGLEALVRHARSLGVQEAGRLMDTITWCPEGSAAAAASVKGQLSRRRL